MERKYSKNKIKRQQFDLRTGIVQTDRQYNALNDPHANYYFVSRAAKQRLMNLKQQIRSQKHKKSLEEKEMIKLIKQKIKFQFPKVQLPLLNDNKGAVQRKFSQQKQFKIKSQRLQKVSTGLKTSRKIQTNFIKRQQQKSVRQQRRQEKSKTKRKKLKKRKVNHEDFVKFISKKKQQLSHATEIQNKQQSS